MSIIRPVKPKPGWELIPNHFAEDTSLSEDAVAVGLWLAVKPEGWEVRPSAIQAAFSRRPGKPRGREWWARVSTELRQANYLRLSRIHGDGGKFSSAWDFNVFGFGENVADTGSAVVGSAGIGSANAGSAPLYNQYSANPIPTTTHHQPVVVDDIENLIEAGVWAEGLTRPIKNETGLRRKIRTRLLDSGPNAEDLHALRAWRAYQERSSADQAQQERDRAAAASREQQRAAQAARADAFLQSLDEASRAAIVKEFGEWLSMHNKAVFQYFRRDGLNSKFAASEFKSYIHSHYLTQQEVAA
jgi:hypothetical protein